MKIADSVRERYSRGAQVREPELCCPVDYDPKLLAQLPTEIVEKDYGCGDPSRYVRAGDTVLDLGSGSGKVCYLTAQLVGPAGRVIGVDINDDMLALARRYQDEMARKLGGDRVRFVKGYIQDLALDAEALDRYLAQSPVRDAAGLAALEAWRTEQRSQRPLIADASVDVVISNCVLNLVAESDRRQMIREIHRVLKPGGKLMIVDYHRPAPLHPLRLLLHQVLVWLEPFALDIWRNEVISWFPADFQPKEIKKETLFGGMYQIISIQR